MSQQINLYQPIFRKEKIVFSAQTIFWLSIGLIVLLLVWSLLVSQRVARLESELSRQQAAERRAVEQISQLRATMPPTEPDASLQAEVEALQERKGELEGSIEALERQMPAAEIELRGRLDALAADVPPGLWLSGIYLADRGETLSVRGNALEPRLVPTWLAELSNSTLFEGLGFRQVRLSERTDAGPGVEFYISTQAGEAQ